MGAHPGGHEDAEAGRALGEEAESVFVGAVVADVDGKHIGRGVQAQRPQQMCQRAALVPLHLRDTELKLQCITAAPARSPCLTPSECSRAQSSGLKSTASPAHSIFIFHLQDPVL